jgi:HAD domain in Swiss Army Knife RNA repair proteins
MKVIFLDIDGILNCPTTPNPRQFPYVVDKRLLLRLQKLLDRTGAKVVLSSSWRIDPVGLFAASIGPSRSSTFAPTSPGARAARRSWIGCPTIQGLPATRSSTTRTTNWMSFRFFSLQDRPA